MESAKRLLGFCKTLKSDKPKSREELEARANLRGYQFLPAQLDAIAAIYVVNEKNENTRL